MILASKLILPCACAFVASIAFGFQFNIKKKHMLSAALGGILSQLVCTTLEINGASEIFSCFISSVAISIYSEMLAKRFHVPVNMYLVVSVIPLVPGSKIYNSMITLIDGNIDGFISQTAETFQIAGAIAMGIFAISSVTVLFKKAYEKIPFNCKKKMEKKAE